MLFVWLFPLLMIVVVTIGNHYALDVTGSLALLVLSIGAVTLWERRRASYTDDGEDP